MAATDDQGYVGIDGPHSLRNKRAKKMTLKVIDRKE
jgi:hypothetical protein